MANNPRRTQGAKRTALTRWLRAQGRPCWICGLPIDYGLPVGAPLTFNCDELIPIAKGGSPYDKRNVDAAHACCNNWRKTKGISEVQATRNAIAQHYGGWSTPVDFVTKAKALKQQPRARATATHKDLARGRERITTAWL